MLAAPGTVLLSSLAGKVKVIGRQNVYQTSLKKMFITLIF
jgi:hypothetical protein